MPPDASLREPGMIITKSRAWTLISPTMQMMQNIIDFLAPARAD